MLLLIVCPAESIGGVREVWHAAACGVRQIKSYVDISAMFEHQIGEIVGSERMIGRDAERLLVHTLGVIPVLLRFIEFPGKDVEIDLPWIVFDGLLVEGECLVH